MLHTTLQSDKVINGDVPVKFTFDVNYDDTGIASGVRKILILASTIQPVLLSCMCEIITAFNAASTNVLTLGTNSTANQLLASGDITEGTPGFYPSGAGVGKLRITSNTEIWAKYTQTGSVAQVETAVVVEDTPGTLTAGNATLTFDSVLTGTLSIVVALATNDTQDQVATKFRAALNANATFAAHYVASGSTNNVVMTALVAAANDTTLNLGYADTTSAGLTDDASSNNTTAGVAPATTGQAKFYVEVLPLTGNTL